MATTKTITTNLGGNRLGSGAKNEISMHRYNRSTHNLSKAWRSSMNVGTLVPCMKLLGLPGDTFSIDLQAIARTVPTIGPLYGAYKLQLDVFECPIRLYNGLLHNNMQKIGLNMKAVKLPKMKIETNIDNPNIVTIDDFATSQISPSSLLHYLGIKGIGDINAYGGNPYETIERTFNAVPLLAYWDIYKNYYANKQEEKGAMLVHAENPDMALRNIGNEEENFNFSTLNTTNPLTTDTNPYYQEILGNIYVEDGMQYEMKVRSGIYISSINLIIYDDVHTTYYKANLTTAFDVTSYTYQVNTGDISFHGINAGFNRMKIVGVSYNSVDTFTEETKIEIFDLSNIDEARIAILQNTGLDNELDVANLKEFPYFACYERNSAGYTLAKYPQNGLALKTYQSDVLENWLQTEWIDGVNGINKITAIDTSSGSFEIDAFILANKVYNMLNRIAVNGGSYEDWQEAVFTTTASRRAETPVYKGGYAAEIVFEEVVSTAEGGDKQLGSLAGKGVVKAARGGSLEIRVEEPSYIMGIVSITPRIDYSTGNDFDMTELDTLDDIHKPALDGIGFQDLLQERAAWWGTYWDTNNNVWVKLAAGKTPAWIDYMTAVNETHGDFCDKYKAMWMTLNRQYEHGRDGGGIDDLTTYIDPKKYNYVFADQSIDAQNFWVQIGQKIIARRVMSAKILPNL